MCADLGFCLYFSFPFTRVAMHYAVAAAPSGLTLLWMWTQHTGNYISTYVCWYICVLTCALFLCFPYFFRVAMHYAVAAAPSGLTLLWMSTQHTGRYISTYVCWYVCVLTWALFFSFSLFSLGLQCTTQWPRRRPASLCCECEHNTREIYRYRCDDISSFFSFLLGICVLTWASVCIFLFLSPGLQCTTLWPRRRQVSLCCECEHNTRENISVYMCVGIYACWPELFFFVFLFFLGLQCTTQWPRRRPASLCSPLSTWRGASRSWPRCVSFDFTFFLFIKTDSCSLPSLL